VVTPRCVRSAAAFTAARLPENPDAAYILLMTNDNMSVPHFYYGKPDIYDGAPWTDMAIADLVAAVEHGSTPSGGPSLPLWHRG
jgi:hypothetical protein